MPSPKATNILTYGLLATAAGVSLILPTDLGPQRGNAAPPMKGTPYHELSAVVRDFKQSHPDFNAGREGHVAGNVSSILANGTPTFVGVTSKPVEDFNISNGATVPTKSFTPMVTIIGSAVTYSGAYDCPVTVRIKIGNTIVEPYGPFDKALAGNVNKGGNPRAYIYPATIDANTAVSVEGRVWIKKSSSSNGASESDWKVYSTFASSPTTGQIKVLRDGDAVPNVAGFQNQASVASYVQKYVNTSTKKATLQKNQAIYLFEFGSTSGAAADFQDLVAMVTLGENTTYMSTLAADGTPPAVTTPKGYKVKTQWRDNAGRSMPPHLTGTATGDIAGEKGLESAGAIYSTQSFSQWFTDTMGTNLSSSISLKLVKNNDVWEYRSSEFHPIDGTLLGNEGKAHNHHFTLSFGTEFTHRAGEKRFFEFEGADDVWVFIDNKLAMDLGGTEPGVKQYLDVDRLGLTDGQIYNLQFFYAQRRESSSGFNIRTNLDLGEGSADVYTVSGVGD